MGPQTIAALVRAVTPDHSEHSQDFLSYDGIDRKLMLACSCGVGLTIDVPATEQPPKAAPKGKASDGA